MRGRSTGCARLPVKDRLGPPQDGPRPRGGNGAVTSESVASEAHLRKFQGLLRELFQFDCADLDFGIYRIIIPGAKAVDPIFKARMFAGVQS